MNNYKAVIVGCTKNNEKYIRSNLLKLVQIGSQFNDYKIIIYENDSSDKTREILEKNKKSNYYYIFENNIQEKKRTVRLERGRNLIMDKVRELDKEYLIMLDLDNVNKLGTFVKTIDSCFDNEDWDVI